MAVDKEIDKTEGVPLPNAIFDESSNFLLYPTLLGIKVFLLSDSLTVGVLVVFKSHGIHFLLTCMSRPLFRKHLQNTDKVTFNYS